MLERVENLFITMVEHSTGLFPTSWSREVILHLVMEEVENQSMARSLLTRTSGWSILDKVGLVSPRHNYFSNPGHNIVLYINMYLLHRAFCQWKMLALQQMVQKCHFLENVSERTTLFFGFCLLLLIIFIVAVGLVGVLL